MSLVRIDESCVPGEVRAEMAEHSGFTDQLTLDVDPSPILPSEDSTVYARPLQTEKQAAHRLIVKGC